MKKVMKIIISIIFIIVLFLAILELIFNYDYIIADIKYPIKQVDTEFFNKMNIDDLNKIYLLSKEKNIRAYYIEREEYSYYSDKYWEYININNNLDDIKEIKELMLKNNIRNIANLWYFSFDYYNYDYELIYKKSHNFEIWVYITSWRVETIINSDWVIIRKCNEYICKDSF